MTGLVSLCSFILSHIRNTGWNQKFLKPKGRIDRAESLYKEAQAAFDKKDFGTIKPKITAAQNMVEKAREALSQARSGS